MTRRATRQFGRIEKLPSGTYRVGYTHEGTTYP